MGIITEVMNRTFELHPDPTREQFQSTMDGLHRLITELEQPRNHELMRFVMAWRRLEQELDKLQGKIQERVAATPVNKVNELLKKLVKKN